MRRIDKYDLKTEEGLCTLVRDIDSLFQANYEVIEISKYLTAETQMKKRVETYNGDMLQAWRDWTDAPKSGRGTHDFAVWLQEEVEVFDDVN